ncbi:hypothetical protein AB6809_22545 [Paraburkholderia sp. RCC_158]|uniref:hypothetical protein n=1 Tax=Paraburkholderia sp. RCC_158 TaxID=3239220 RepID=UPI0035246686
MMPVIAEGILIDEPVSRISIQHKLAVRSFTISRSPEKRWSMVSLLAAPHQGQYACLVTGASVNVVGFGAGDMFGLDEDAILELIPAQRKAPPLRETKLLFTLGNPFAELPAACLLLTDAGLSGGRHSGKVVVVSGSPIAKRPQWVCGNRDRPTASC